jgi:Flp pilus assembly protein TadB
LINGEYISRLFNDTCGWIMIGVSVAMITVGFLIIRKIVDIEV